MIGKTVSHYKILEELGRGGMGVVYKALDTKLDRTVALKFLPPHTLGSEQEKARFIHEAKAAAALSHPNIATIHEIDEQESEMFIVMEYIEGLTLKAKIESGPMNLSEVIEIAIQTAEGLSAAGEKDIVHRDIKPTNILLTRRGAVKIMDFGLAKLRGQPVLTREGTTIGTVAYMSPEQAQGEAVDHRTDIWSLGVVLYEMITGRQPYKGEYEQAVVYSILNEDPEPVTALRTGVPMELERIISKSLRRDTDRRYQGVADFITDLRQLQGCLSKTRTASSFAARPEKAKRLPWWFWPSAVVMIVIGAITLPRYFTENETPVFEGRKMLVVLPLENLGSPEDEPFAAGMTEEITSRLAAVSGLGVISRTSAVQYDRTGKTLKQIGRDFGVDYVLEGTIRWNKKAPGGSRVRVTSQLIRVSNDTHLWAETYDRVMEDIFAVQSEIAEQIITQLGITMLERERSAVEAKPTENLLAYEAYLHGLSYLATAGAMEDDFRKAETLFKQAVELDPEFALAFATLSQIHGEIYFFGFEKTEERLAECRSAAERALELQPELPEAHMALGGYYYMGFLDCDRALKEFAIAARGMPNSPILFEAIAYIWRRQGLFREAIGYLEKAAILNPRNFWYRMQIGLTYSMLREYAEADRQLDRSLALEQEQIAIYFVKHLNTLNWTGDLEKSRAIIESAPIQTTIIITRLFWQNIYERNYEKALEILSEMPEETWNFASSRRPRDILAGLTYRLMGDPERARSSFKSALVFLEKKVPERSDEGAFHLALGLVYAGLGRRDDAIREGKKGLELLSNDKLLVSEYEWELVRIYLMLDEQESAIDHIEHLLSIPSLISCRALEIYPIVDPLRENPRFKQILKKYSAGIP